MYFDRYLHEAGLHERFIDIIVSEFYDTMVLVLKKSRFYKEFITVVRTNVRSFGDIYRKQARLNTELRFGVIFCLSLGGSKIQSVVAEAYDQRFLLCAVISDSIAYRHISFAVVRCDVIDGRL